MWLLTALLTSSALATDPIGTFPDCGEDNRDACPSDFGGWDMISWIPGDSKATVREAELARPGNQPPRSAVPDVEPSAEVPPTPTGDSPPTEPFDPFAAQRAASAEFDAGSEQHTGCVLGIAMAGFRTPDGEDRFLVLPGDDVKLTFPTAGTPPKARKAPSRQRRRSCSMPTRWPRGSISFPSEARP